LQPRPWPKDLAVAVAECTLAVVAAGCVPAAAECTAVAAACVPEAVDSAVLKQAWAPDELAP
jgi:hypothetical protein